MELWQAIVLGVVEGLTEYLPVSSTGHLLVAQRLMGIGGGEAANAWAVVVQGGAILAVLGLYRRRVGQMFAGVAGRDPEGWRLACCLVVAFLPVAVIGFLADEAVEAYLFGTWPVVAAWAAGGGVLLWLGPWFRGQTGRPLREVAVRDALIVGAAQGLALWPGVSRSLVTILAGVAAGLGIPAAVEFSFLLGALTLGAATVYKAWTSGPAMLAAYGLPELAIGFLSAWLSAAAAVRWMIHWVSRRGLAVFGWWRLAAAVLAGTLAAAGVI